MGPEFLAPLDARNGRITEPHISHIFPHYCCVVDNLFLKVRTGKAHIGIANFIVHYYRHQVIQYSVTTYDMPTAMIVMSPQPLNPALNILKPFDVTLWLSFVGVVLVLVVLGPILSQTSNLNRDVKGLDFLYIVRLCTNQVES